MGFTVLASLEVLKSHKNCKKFFCIKIEFAVQIEPKNSSAVSVVAFDVQGSKINGVYL